MNELEELKNIYKILDKTYRLIKMIKIPKKFI